MVTKEKSVMQEPEQKREQMPPDSPDFDFDFDFGEEDHAEEKKDYNKPEYTAVEGEEEKPYFHKMYEKVSKNLSPQSMPLDSKKVLEELKAHHSQNRTNREAVTHTYMLQERIHDTLEELHKHEEEWKELHDMQHEISQKIADKEKDIEFELDKFKILIRKLTYTKLCSEEQAFSLTDGQKIRSISQLITSLPTISDEVFKSHITAYKNDVAAWIEGVFFDAPLADIVRKCQTRKDLYVALKKAITFSEDA